MKMRLRRGRREEHLDESRSSRLAESAGEAYFNGAAPKRRSDPAQDIPRGSRRLNSGLETGSGDVEHTAEQPAGDDRLPHSD